MSLIDKILCATFVASLVGPMLILGYIVVGLLIDMRPPSKKKDR
jgi:uncharacterized membrane protein